MKEIGAQFIRGNQKRKPARKEYLDRMIEEGMTLTEMAEAA